MMHVRTSRIQRVSVPLLLAAMLGGTLLAGCSSREEPPPRKAPTGGEPATHTPATAPQPPATRPGATTLPSTQPAPPNPQFVRAGEMYKAGLKLARQNKLIEADSLFVQVLEIAPGFANGHWARGKIQAQYGRHENAITHYLTAIQFDPNSAHARISLGISFASLGRLDTAIEQFETALKIDPKSAQGHQLLGRAREQQRQVTEALACYRQAVQVDPNYLPGHLSLASLLRTQGQGEKAEAVLVDAVRLNPKEDGLVGQLALMLNANSKPGKAITRFEQALKIKGDNPETLNNYAWFLATHAEDKFRDGARAVTLAKQACELTSSRVPHFLDTLAAAYAEAKQFDEAVKTAEQAVAAAEGAGDKDLAWDVRARIQLYKTRRAYHGQKPDAPAKKPAPAPATSPATTTPPPPAKPG